MYEEDELNDLEILDDMYDFEKEFEEKEKYNGKYYIGAYIYMNDIQMENSLGTVIKDSKKLFLGMAISVELFFKYKDKYIKKYLSSCIIYGPYTLSSSLDLKINIMKLQITNNDLYLVELKTYWLKLIQRHWKKIIEKRKEIIENKKSFSYLRLRELGKHKRINIPNLHGMLYIYNKSNKMD
jgi:hypothetical protein